MAEAASRESLARGGDDGDAGIGSERLRQWLYALLLALPLLWGLGHAPLFDVDEGAFAEASREMLASGDFGQTTLNGAPRYDKPMGVYWLQSASIALLGPTPAAVRLPSALAAWAMALALVGFARPRWGPAAAWCAGLVVASSAGVLAIGRAATADGLLNLLLVLAACDAWRHLESGRRGPLRRAFAWVGLGLLVKGPVALVVPGAAVFLWCAASGRWAQLHAMLLDGPGWLLMLAIALPWYLYALDQNGMDFVNGFLMRHNVQRFTGTLEGHAGSPLYYLLMLPLLALPWTPLLVAVLARARSLWREPLARFLLLWAGFVLVFFSLSGTKLPHYMLYGYAPLALLMGRLLAQASSRLMLAVWLTLAAWAGLLLGLPATAPHWAPRIGDPLYRALIGGAPAPAGGLALAAGVVLLVLAAATLPRARRAGPVPLAAAAWGLALLFSAWATPWWGEALQGPVRRAAEQAGRALAHAPAPVVQSGINLPSFAFYLGQPVPHREPPQAGDLVFTRADRVPAALAGARRVFAERGLLLLQAPATP